MADPSNGNGKRYEGPGVQAYRWVVMAGIGLVALLTTRVLNQIDETSDQLVDLRNHVTSLSTTYDSRINAHAQRLDSIDRRNDQQDGKLDELQRSFWSLPRQAHQAAPPAVNSGPIVPSAPSLEVYPPLRGR